MTTVWPISNFPLTLDTFSPSMVDGVDFILANHPNTLASAVVAIQGKLGRTGYPITGLGGVSFEAAGKSSNPGSTGIPTIWVDNSGGPGLVLKYTDELGTTYSIGSSESNGLNYLGYWNASTNTPELTDGSGDNGSYYVVSVEGTTEIDGISTWAVGDWIISNGDTWQKIDNQQGGGGGGLSYLGEWNAASNIPALSDGSGSNGEYYVVSTDGATDIDGESSWRDKDWIISNGTTWSKINNNITSIADYDVRLPSPSSDSIPVLKIVENRIDWSEEFDPSYTSWTIGSINLIQPSGETVPIKDSETNNNVDMTGIATTTTSLTSRLTVTSAPISSSDIIFSVVLKAGKKTAVTIDVGDRYGVFYLDTVTRSGDLPSHTYISDIGNGCCLCSMRLATVSAGQQLPVMIRVTDSAYVGDGVTPDYYISMCHLYNTTSDLEGEYFKTRGKAYDGDYVFSMVNSAYYLGSSGVSLTGSGVGLKRIDTGAYEDVQVGIEYFSPEQHSELYGKVIRSFYSGTGVVGNVTLRSDGVSTVLGSGGYMTNQTSGSKGILEGYSSLYSNTSGAIILERADAFNDSNDSWNVWVDYVLISSPALSPGMPIQPSTDPTVLQRVDSGSWEHAQVGVEYFSPNQCDVASTGPVIRKYFGSTASGATLVLATEDLVHTKIWIGDPTNQLVIDSGDAVGTEYCNVLRKVATGNLVLNVTSYYSPVIKMWVEYTLQTPPVLIPTGQPFADPMSQLLKRLDTGHWETPQVGVLYYAKNQSFGKGNTVICQNVAGSGASGYITTAVADSKTIKSAIGSDGVYLRDGEAYLSNFYSSSSTFVRTKMVISSSNLVIELGTDYGTSNSYDFWFYFTIN